MAQPEGQDAEHPGADLGPIKAASCFLWDLGELLGSRQEVVGREPSM